MNRYLRINIVIELGINLLNGLFLIGDKCL